MSTPVKKQPFYENTAQNGSVKGVFEHLDSLINAIHKLESDGIKNYMVMSPLPRHDLEDAIYKGKPSPVRWFTMTGAIFGGTMGFSLQSITHMNWPMIIPAGKPLVSIPAFIVITFESTVLWGCLFTLLGMILLTRLHTASKLQIEVCDPRFSDDKFGLLINDLPRNRAEDASKILSAEGAMEVINGWNIEREVPVEVPPPSPDSPESMVEPDDPDTSLLGKLAVAVTIILVVSFLGVKMLHQYTVASELDKAGYNYKSGGIAPSYRTIK
jgi:molybdopterin-containing oxidoreductase family membrane subunit